MKFEQNSNDISVDGIPDSTSEDSSQKISNLCEQNDFGNNNQELGLGCSSFEQGLTALQEMERTTPKRETSEKVLRRIKKYVALAVVGLAPLLVTGCGEKSQSDGKQTVSATENVEGERHNSSGRLSEQFRKDSEVRREIARMILENDKQIMSGIFDLSTNHFLKYYNERLGKSVPPEHVPVMEVGVQMRMLEIAEKKGIDIHNPSVKISSKNLVIAGVPLVFEIGSQTIGVENEDLTDQELETLQGSYRFFQNNHEVMEIFRRLGLSEASTQTKESQTVSPTSEPLRGNIRQSVDFDKEANF